MESKKKNQVKIRKKTFQMLQQFQLNHHRDRDRQVRADTVPQLLGFLDSVVPSVRETVAFIAPHAE